MTKKIKVKLADLNGREWMQVNKGDKIRYAKSAGVFVYMYEAEQIFGSVESGPVIELRLINTVQLGVSNII